MAKTKELRTCKISNGNCKAPAGYGISGVGTCDGDTSTQGTCWGCGEPVCTGPNCSRVVTWRGLIGHLKPTRRRICEDCRSEVRIPVKKTTSSK